MEFTLTIKLGNDAMQTGDDVARSLRKVADKLEESYGIDYMDEWDGLGGYILDLNGNNVGGWSVSQ